MVTKWFVMAQGSSFQGSYYELYRKKLLKKYYYKYSANVCRHIFDGRRTKLLINYSLTNMLHINKTSKITMQR